jgi:hypothetical protein
MGLPLLPLSVRAEVVPVGDLEGTGCGEGKPELPEEWEPGSPPWLGGMSVVASVLVGGTGGASGFSGIRAPELKSEGRGVEGAEERVVEEPELSGLSGLSGLWSGRRRRRLSWSGLRSGRWGLSKIGFLCIVRPLSGGTRLPAGSELPRALG